MKRESVTNLIDEVIEDLCGDDEIKSIIYNLCDTEKAYWGRKRDFDEKLKKIDKIFSSSKSLKGGK